MTATVGRMTNIGGDVAPGWGPVADAFRTNFDSGLEVGAGVSVYHQGTKVVDLWGGAFEKGGDAPYTEDTLQLVFSTTKGITAIAVAMCVQRGLLDYEAKVVDYWPEFAAAGKESITVAQLLSHQAGLATVDGAVTLDEALDWDVITKKLAEQAPLWEPGTAHGYHAVTYGWLAGELVRRVDPECRSFGGFVADEIVRPLGAEFWIGLPDEQQARVSPMIPSPPPEDPAIAAMMLQMMGPETLGGRALALNGAFSLAGEMPFNLPRVRAAEIPAANGVGNAPSLARIYAATIGEVDGVRLLDEATVARASATVTPENEPDQCLVVPTTFGMGFMTYGMVTPMLGAGSFGHAGAGGSLAFAEPKSGIGFGYVMNKMEMNLAGDTRPARLLEAVVACAG